MYSQPNANQRSIKRLVSIVVCQSELLKRQGSRDSEHESSSRIIVSGWEWWKGALDPRLLSGECDVPC